MRRFPRSLFATEPEFEQAAAELIPELGPAAPDAEALQHDLHGVAKGLPLCERELHAQPAADRSVAMLVLVELDRPVVEG